MFEPFLFLFDCVQDEPGALELASGLFETDYASIYCGQENGWQVLQLAVEDGGTYSSAGYPGPEIDFECSWELGARAVAEQMGFFGGFEVPAAGQVGVTELCVQALQRGAGAAAERYVTLSGSDNWRPGRSGDSSDGFGRMRLAEMTEFLAASRHPPFTSVHCAPGRYRCFDMTDQSSHEGPFSILLVDINS